MMHTETQTKKSSTIKLGLAFLAGIAVIYIVIAAVMNVRLSNLQFETKLLISEQETRLATIAEAISRNGADEITERIIMDCSVEERVAFDGLLSNLDRGLSRAQLVELERLFGRCGNFFSERKAVMVSRLEREIEIYETFVTQLNNLSNTDNFDTYNVSGWNDLAALETKQSVLFAELVDTQDQIITSLLQGNSPSSDELMTILQAANEIQETLQVTTVQTTAVRSTLVSL
jgi:hypothetical protein